jgi:hypothetical protein
VPYVVDTASDPLPVSVVANGVGDVLGGSCERFDPFRDLDDHEVRVELPGWGGGLLAFDSETLVLRGYAWRIPDHADTSHPRLSELRDIGAVSLKLHPRPRTAPRAHDDDASSLVRAYDVAQDTLVVRERGGPTPRSRGRLSEHVSVLFVEEIIAGFVVHGFAERLAGSEGVPSSSVLPGLVRRYLDCLEFDELEWLEEAVPSYVSRAADLRDELRSAGLSAMADTLDRFLRSATR